MGKSEGFYKAVILTISIVVLGLVSALYFITPPELNSSFNLKLLPLFHAILNGTTALLLVAALIFVKRKNIAAHKISMLTAFVFSALFLVSYVFYHTFSESTKYGGEGTLKYIYFFILITHIILSATFLPVILLTFLRALTGQFEKHKKMARYAFPVWLYVAISGVLVYILISPYY